jgi:WXG100 family type VII secretion target
MATIHVNTDVMRQLGQLFVQLNDQLGGQTRPQIQSHIGNLESDWQGVSRQRFEQMFQQWTSAANQLQQQGDQIGQHLQNTATQFENVDSQS